MYSACSTSGVEGVINTCMFLIKFCKYSRNIMAVTILKILTTKSVKADTMCEIFEKERKEIFSFASIINIIMRNKYRER